MKNTLENLVSKAEFLDVDNQFASSVLAQGTVSLSRVLASDDQRICGPAQLLVVVDEEKLFPDKDRKGNSYLLHAVFDCPGDLLAASKFQPTVNTFSAIMNDVLDWVVFPQDQKIILTRLQFTTIPFTINVWDQNGILELPERKVLIEGFYIKNQGINFNTILESVEISDLVRQPDHDYLSNDDFWLYQGVLKIKVSDQVCDFLYENQLLEMKENIGNVASDVTWMLMVHYNGTEYNDLVEYNNKLELTTDVVCGGVIDLILPELPEKGELLLFSLQNGDVPFVQYGEPVSFRLQLELLIADEASRNRLCEAVDPGSPQRYNPSRLEAAICPSSKVKPYIKLLLSVRISTVSDSSFGDAVLNELVDLSKGKYVTTMHGDNGDLISATYFVENLYLDEDDIFKLCCEPSSTLSFQVR